jgi:hypothetical protein
LQSFSSATNPCHFYSLPAHPLKFLSRSHNTSNVLLARATILKATRQIRYPQLSRRAISAGPAALAAHKHDTLSPRRQSNRCTLCLGRYHRSGLHSKGWFRATSGRNWLIVAPVESGRFVPRGIIHNAQLPHACFLGTDWAGLSTTGMSRRACARVSDHRQSRWLEKMNRSKRVRLFLGSNFQLLQSEACCGSATSCVVWATGPPEAPASEDGLRV